MQSLSHRPVSNRINILDGFRCLCIVAVISFHFLARYTIYYGENLYPYHSAYYHFYFYQYGYLGVHCFFIISGFVIFMTLEKSGSIKDFAVKRFIRLWPTLLICSLVTFVVLYYFPLSLFPTNPRYFLPTLTITQPLIWSRIFNTDQMNYMDGVEWSLTCEVVFYLISGCLYFYNKVRFYSYWLIFVSVLLGIYFSTAFFGLQRVNNYLNPLLFPKYMVFFTTGMYLYLLYTSQKLSVARHLITALLFFTQLFFIQSLYEDLFIVAFVMLMLAFIYKPTIVGIFSNKMIAKIGFFSYSLYLIHSNIGLVIITRLSILLNTKSVYLTVIPAIVIVFSLSFIIEKLIYTYINPRLKKMLGFIRV